MVKASRGPKGQAVAVDQTKKLLLLLLLLFIGFHFHPMQQVHAPPK
jgi:hypothetical protein